jgi:hypothetical protein
LKSKPSRKAVARRSPTTASATVAAVPISASVSAWEMIEAGRYMPRRTRGSFPGRELG